MRRALGSLSVSGLSGSTVCNGIVLLAGVGSGVTLARSLGPAGRGELAAALLWPNILMLFGEMGLGFAFAYYVAKWREKLDELWAMSLIAGLAFGGVLALAGY